MNAQMPTGPGVLKVVENVRAAFERGELKTYEPLKVAGTGYKYSTCMVSWGPMMRR
ncbi:hypothetical protein AWB81_06650 [Caballeronia arationis]|uniref:hypothetical protein n=1 Tax=Caballeronia arationis TaxID=1777142 RepID=UPI00074CEDE3|nr:hypothetical protein [Caballeronia arationis]SAL04294.1 hypothetical protein AWB81_06650 [Caballeronia arationis]